MTGSQIRRLVLAFFLLVGVYSIARFELTHSLTHFIPSKHEAELVELSLELVHSPLARRMVLSVGGGPERGAVAQALGEYLAQHSEVAWVETGFDEEKVRGFYDLYFDRRFYMASEAPEEEIPKMFSEAGLQRSADELKIRLAGPMGTGASRTAPRDPLGLFERILERFRRAQPTRSGESGNFVSLDGQFAMVLLELRSSPFDSENQKPLLRDLDAEFARLDALYGGGFELEQSGVNRVSVATERGVRADVSFVSTVSIGLVCGLFLILFRSFRQLAIVIMSPAAGFLVALAIGLSLPDPLHGITLAFGFVLIGVAIDYPIHLINHHALGPVERSIDQTVQRIRPSLGLSAVTTTLAFLALALSEFPGLREMGLFAAIGVPVAAGLTLFGLPAFLPEQIAPTRTQESLAAVLVRITEGLNRRRGWIAAVGLGLLVLLGVGLPELRWEDDPSDLMTPDLDYLAESERVRQRVSDFDGGRFVVGRASDRESALALNDAIFGRLEAARLAGDIEGQSSLHTFLWSEDLQRRNLEAFQLVSGRDGQLESAFLERGFRKGSFGAFGAEIDVPIREPLRVEDLKGSFLGRTLDLLFEMDDGFAVVTYLRGVNSPDRVRARLADLEHADFIDQEEIVAGVYKGYRQSTVWMVALGGAVAFGVLLSRYRDWLRALLAFVPAGAGTLGTLALYGVAGHPVNVIAAVSLLVVLGMGVDYGVFCLNSVRSADGPGPTLSSLLISCLTSIFVFGTLALSGQPALQSIGMTTGLGVALALFVSPSLVVLANDLLADPKETR